MKALRRLETGRCGTRQNEPGKEEVAIRGVGTLKLRWWRGFGVSEVGWKIGSLEVRG